MKKQIISAVLSAACIVSGISAFAEVTPRVIVDGFEIIFEDQKPVIKDDRTLIPVRGVMEATGAKVNWYAEDKRVRIQTHDFWRLAEFTVDSNIMKAAKYKEDMLNMEVNDVELDVPAQIINDRTLIPLRAVNDAFLYETTWDDETKTAYVKSNKYVPTEETDATIYLTTDAEDVKEGDTVNVYVNIKNTEEKDKDRVINGVTMSLIYDKTKLKLENGTLCNNETEISGIGAINADFSEDSLKTATVTVDESACLKGDGIFYKLTFTALADDCGTVTLSNRYNSRLGFDTTILMSKDTKSENMTPRDYVYDATPLEIK